MKTLDEKQLAIALTQRDMDCRDLRRIFKPEWLKDKELLPIVKATYKFLDEHNVVPSLSAVAEYMQDEDKELYEVRHKALITELKMMPIDTSLQMLAIKKAKDKAAALSLESMIHTADFQKSLAEGEGDSLLSVLSHWITEHTRTAGTGPVDIKTGLEQLIRDTPWTGKATRIPSGIRPIDEWGGGLRPGQLGIVIAPTGGGKSTTLLNIAYNVAMSEGRNVLFLTNELSKEDQLERFLARMQGPDPGQPLVPLNVIQDDPVEAFKGMEHKWRHKLQERLYIDAIDLNTTAEQIEAMIVHLKAQKGFDPDLIVIDYMEKMKPSDNVRRDKAEWIFMQEIAKELIRLGNRRRAGVWTAVQTNRQGLNRKIGIGMDTVQGSIRHLQAADIVVSCQKKYMEILGAKVECMHFVEHKMRSAKMADREMYVKTDLRVMYISNEEIVPPDDTEIQAADEAAEEREERREEQRQKRGGRGILSDKQAKEGT